MAFVPNVNWVNDEPPGFEADEMIRMQLGIADAHQIAGAAQTAAAELAARIVDVKALGAMGDGVTDDAAAIQAAIDTVAGAGGGVVTFPHGRYLLGTSLALPSDVTLRGDGSATIDYSQAAMQGSARFGIRAAGSTGAALTLSADATRGEYAVTLTSAAGLAAGDWVVLQSGDHYPYGGSVDVDRGEIKRVRAIDGATLTFEQALYDSYATADTAAVRPVRFVENVRVEGLRLAGPNAAGDGSRAIELTYVNGFRVTGCDIEGTDIYCVNLSSTIRGEVSGNRMRGVRYDGVTGGVFYAVSVMNASQWVRVADNHAEQVRHLYVNSANSAGQGHWGCPRFVTVAGNVATNQQGGGSGRSWAFEHHGFGDGILIANNVVDGCYGGFVTRGPGVTFADNIVRGWYGYALQIHPQTADARNIVITGNQVSDRSIEGGGAAAPSAVQVDLTAATTVQNVVVAGNVIDVDAAGGTYGAIYASGTVVGGLTIRDNQIAWTGDGEAPAWVVRTFLPGAVISGNRLVNCAYGIRPIGAGSIITGNTVQAATQQTKGHGVYVDAADCTVTGNVTDNTFQCVQSSANGTGLALVGNVGRSNTDPFTLGTTTGVKATANVAMGATTTVNTE